MKPTKGQIGLGTLLTLGGMLVASVASVYGIKLDAQKDVAAVSERTAKLETSVPLMQEDLRDIKDSIENIERALNVKPSSKSVKPLPRP